MRVDFFVAAFVVCATAVPVAEPLAATPVGYGPQTVTVTVNAQPTSKTSTSTSTSKSTTSTKQSTVTVGPVATSTTMKSTTSTTKTSSTTTKSTTSSKTTSTSAKTTSTSAKTTSASTKTSATSTKASTTSTSTKTSATSTKALTTSTSTKTSATSTKALTTSTSTKTSATSTKASTTSTKTTAVVGTPLTATTKMSTTSTQATAAVPSTLEQIALYHHNIHRSNHSAADVKWSTSLASIAASIAANCNYQHNTTAGGGGYGQNIAAGVKANNISEVITDLFYNGEMPYYSSLYGEAQPSYANFGHWGHFSQLVWKDTTTIGCAVQYCPGGLANTGSGILPYFTVCNYEPAGNYGGEYAANIGRPLGHAVAHWNTGL